MDLEGGFYVFMSKINEKIDFPNIVVEKVEW